MRQTQSSIARPGSSSVSALCGARVGSAFPGGAPGHRYTGHELACRHAQVDDSYHPPAGGGGGFDDQIRRQGGVPRASRRCT